MADYVVYKRRVELIPSINRDPYKLALMSDFNEMIVDGNFTREVAQGSDVDGLYADADNHCADVLSSENVYGTIEEMRRVRSHESGIVHVVTPVLGEELVSFRSSVGEAEEAARKLEG